MNKIAAIYCFAAFALVSIFISAEKPNKIYFTINHADKIVIPLQLNDSVTANLTFDTGGSFCLDSAFYANNMNVSNYTPTTTKQERGSAWTEQKVNMSFYKDIPEVKIGNISFKYEKMDVFNYKSFFKSDSDGLFNIPIDDTTHIWEMNFEHNYLEIHSSEDFTMPENTFLLPMIRNGGEIFIKFPISINYLGNTLSTNYMYVIDTGMRWDIALKCPSHDDHTFFENQQENAVWTSYLNGYYKHNTIKATLFGNLEVDSLRFYTFDNSQNIFGRLIGYNFLKRFNVFFDVRNKRVGLQPIKNFQRILNPKSKRFHFSTLSNSKGQFFVKKIANYPGNYYKAAGLQEGDEIVSVNSKPYKSITRDERREFYRQDTLAFELIRKGRPLKIVVQVDKSEMQGD